MGNGIDDLSLDRISTGYSKYSSSYINANEETSSYLDFDSYLKVLAAQMSNQDFNDPMSDSEMLQQMASYSMLEGISKMTSQANITYASGLVGKAVTVSDGSDLETGIVESVVIQDGKPLLCVNGGLYEQDKITDICDTEVFQKLHSLIGLRVNATTTSGGENGEEEKTDSVTGTITKVLFVGGEAMVVIDDKKAYPLSVISLASSGNEGSGTEEGGDDGSEGVSTGAAEGTVTGEAGNGSSDPAAVSETATVTSEATATETYSMHSEKVYNELMSTIDAISGRVTETANASTSTEYYSDDDMLVTTVSQLSVPDYAAGYTPTFGDIRDSLSIDDFDPVSASEVNPLLGPASSSSNSNPASTSAYYTSQTSSSASGYGSITYGPAREGYVTVTPYNFSSILASDKDGKISSILTNEQAYDLIASGKYTARYHPLHGLELVSDTAPGISTSDCIPHRLNADLYPEEAALADRLGTRMYDIKYIHNDSVNHRIDTSNVIAETASGRQATDIGFSGIGQLGEVITFKDGTQRVEIMLKSGKSIWLTTSGKYTIDEICALDVPFGSLQDKFTEAESYIRHYGIKDKLNGMAVNRF